MDVSIRKIFKTFYDSGLHGKEFPRTTFCIYELNNGEEKQVMIEKSCKVYAEDKFITDMKTHLDKNKDLPMKLYINYSPCSGCTKKLITFVTDHRIDLTIYFAHLYVIKRKSCEGKEGCNCDANGSEGNERGLQELNHNSVKLKTFTKDISMELKNLLEKKLAADLKVLEDLAEDTSGERKTRYKRRG